MGDTTTANYGWVMPAVGASADSWGTKLNTDLSQIDTDLFAVAVYANNNFLPLTGGTLSGQLDVGANGIGYTGFTGHAIAFGWNGSMNCYVDGAYEGDIAMTSWVVGSFKPIGAYTPNQSVDVNSNPTFNNVQINGAPQIANGVFYVGNVTNYWFGRFPSNGTWYIQNAGSNIFSVDPSGNTTVTGAVTAGGTMTAGGTVQAGGQGVIYAGYGGNVFAEAWDGQSLFHYINGGQQHLIYSTGNGPYAPLYEIQVNGNVGLLYGYIPASSGGSTISIPFSWVSDRALKRNIQPATVDAIAVINSIPTYVADHVSPFEGAPPQHWACSIMADEVGTAIPAALIPPDGEKATYATLREGPIISMLLRAVQQLSAEVALLKQAHA